MTRPILAFCVAALALHVAPALGAGTAPPADTTQAAVKASLLSTRTMQINAYPYAYYTPETELAFGAGGITTFYTNREDAILRPSKITASGYYSTKKQYKFSLSPQLYFARNSTIASANLDYGYYIDKYWGVGNDTQDLEKNQYQSRAFGLDATLQLPPVIEIVKGSSTGFIYDLFNNDIQDTRGNPELAADSVRGRTGGVSSGLGLSWTTDTRNSVFYPTNGRYYQLKAVYYGQWLGGSFDFNRYDLDLRQYVSLAPNKIVAFQLYMQSVWGSPPFYELAALGGQRIMRGYYQGRYRDQTLAAAQAEYRGHIWKRFGFVAFAAVGDVGSDLSAVNIGDLKTSLGGGLRFKFNQAENVNLRADVGWGRSTSGVYFGLEEAF